MYISGEQGYSHNHSTWAKSGNLILTQGCYLIHTLYSNFINCPNNVPSLGWHIAFSCHVSWVSFNQEHFLSLPLSFMTLIFLRSSDHLFCRIFLNLGLSGFYSWLDSGDALGAGIPGRGCLSFSSAPHQEVCHIISNVSFDRLLKVVSAKLLHWKMTIFSFVVNKYLAGDTFRL